MSKEPIDLATSVERHQHHTPSDHHHGTEEESETRASRRINYDFEGDSLSKAEQILAVSIGIFMLIGFMAIVIFILFR